MVEAQEILGRLESPTEYLSTPGPTQTASDGARGVQLPPRRGALKTFQETPLREQPREQVGCRGIVRKRNC